MIKIADIAVCVTMPKQLQIVNSECLNNSHIKQRTKNTYKYINLERYVITRSSLEC